MELSRAEKCHLAELMGWFPDARSALNWGGPGLTFPFEPKRFMEEIHFERMDGFVWVERRRLAGFAQTYLKYERCHLARIALAPDRRGQGHGRPFIRMVAEAGCAAYGAAECSLYVLDDNLPALRCYRSLGFAPAYDPKPPTEVPNCLFLVASREALR
ncbi:MAG: GNAT family N-acetyltransferase [Xanthomonadales bacterium]|nr:GNAT family N-acetyltransferase [Xanthomonadales bacterium]